MKSNLNFKSLLIAIILPMAFAACSEDIEGGSAPVKDGEYVTVNIDVSAGELSAMTATESTRAVTDSKEDIICETVTPGTTRAGQGINDPTPTSSTVIKNLWVLQYDGEGDDAKLVGTPAYIQDYTVAANRTAKLVASTTNNTIVFLANTFDGTLAFQQNSTIRELKARIIPTPTLGTILSVDPATKEAGGTFPTDGDYYQRLNGMYATTIASGTTLTCALQHNICRVSVNITNNTAGTTYPVTLTYADIENVPACVYFITDYTGYTSGTAVGKPSTADMNLYGKNDYTNVITWTSSEGTSTTTKSAKLYIPANESGTITNTNPKLKSLFAPSRATILRIHGTYADGTDNIPITYSFALGEDMTSNYQLIPNGDYVYNITLNARGDKETDGRVSYGSAGGVDYTNTAIWPLSNCYICNPPVTSTGTATYKIPVARVDQFWGGGNYENAPNNCLESTNDWTVSVIWSDMPVNASNFIISKAIGTGKDDYFEVQIPGTTVKGNVIIGIKNTLSSDWLWSWHLWVTDYCPDEAKYLTQQGAFLDGTDTYHLTGGDVQRYTKAATGYVQKVYMDRCIGAMDASATGYPRGTMYYQFGRKDPFPGNSEEYYESGTNKVTYTITTKAYNQTDANTQPANVPYSVKNPTTFITSSSSYWTYSDIYNPTSGNTSIVWQDPYSSYNGKKSIFDPSPSGWKVTTSHTGLSYNSFSGGICYANTTAGGKGSVVLPALGCRSYSNGSLGNGRSYGFYWSSSPLSTADASGLSFGSGGLYAHVISNYDDPERATGKPVRPVQE